MRTGVAGEVFFCQNRKSPVFEMAGYMKNFNKAPGSRKKPARAPP